VRFIVKTRGDEREFPLSPGLYIVGREGTCDLSLESSRVSRRHMSCTVKEDAVEVRDLGSRNGVYVGGVRVESATLQHGDKVTLGDVSLVFDGQQAAVQGAAAGTVETASARAAPRRTPQEQEQQEEEETPFEAALVPAIAGEGEAELIEREGKWYVREASTGREVEIVPAVRKPVEKKRIFASPAGRFILPGAAVVVLALLAVALQRTLRPAPPPSASSSELSQLLDATLKALDGGQIGKARQLAGAAKAAVPERPAAAIAEELVGLWEPWQEDFFAHWRNVEARLKELYQHHHTIQAQLFVRKYRQFIQEQLVFAERINEARGLYAQGRFSEAWAMIGDLPADSVALQQAQDFQRDVRARYLEYLEERLAAARRGQDWNSAVALAKQMARDFPEHRESAEESMRQFQGYLNHVRSLQQARQQAKKGDYVAALTALDSIPEASPYHQEALALRNKVQASETVEKARRLYDNGKGEEALKLLEGAEDSAAESLAGRIKEVMRLEKAIQEAIKENQLLKVESLWERLIATEANAQNAFHKKAQGELKQMPVRRREYARQLVKEGNELYKRGEFAQARESFEEAMRTDPEGAMGKDLLARLRTEGRIAYLKGINLVNEDKEGALELLRKACDMLSPADPYYFVAMERKKALEENN